MARSRANSAVMQRSNNRPASEPLREVIEGSGCCERATQARSPDASRWPQNRREGSCQGGDPVSAISVVAGARNHLQANRPLEFRFEITVWCDEMVAPTGFTSVAVLLTASLSGWRRGWRSRVTPEARRPARRRLRALREDFGDVPEQRSRGRTRAKPKKTGWPPARDLPNGHDCIRRRRRATSSRSLCRPFL